MHTGQVHVVHETIKLPHHLPCPAINVKLQMLGVMRTDLAARCQLCREVIRGQHLGPGHMAYVRPFQRARLPVQQRQPGRMSARLLRHEKVAPRSGCGGIILLFKRHQTEGGRALGGVCDDGDAKAPAHVKHKRTALIHCGLVLDERHEKLAVAVHHMAQQLQHLLGRIFGVMLVHEGKADGRHEHRAGLQPRAA